MVDSKFTVQNLVFFLTPIVGQMNSVLSFGTGAPTSTCKQMTPGHGRQSRDPSPYTLQVIGNNTYTPGGEAIQGKWVFSWF